MFAKEVCIALALLPAYSLNVLYPQSKWEQCSLVVSFPGRYVDLLCIIAKNSGFLNSGILLHRLRVPGITKNYAVLKLFKFSGLARRIKDFISFKNIF